MRGLRRLQTPIGLIHLARRPAESRCDLGEPVRKPGLHTTLSALAQPLRSFRACHGRQGPGPQAAAGPATRIVGALLGEDSHFFPSAQRAVCATDLSGAPVPKRTGEGVRVRAYTHSNSRFVPRFCRLQTPIGLIQLARRLAGSRSDLGEPVRGPRRHLLLESSVRFWEKTQI